MLRKLRNAVKQKGQGIIEYALLLSFVVGIAMLLNGANLGGAVKDTFDSVANLLAGNSSNSSSSTNTYAQRTSQWRQYATDKELLDNTTPEERLKSDQELLVSIGEMFLGQKLSDVESMLAQYNTHIAYGTVEDPTGYIWNSRSKYTNPADATMNESDDVTLFKYQDPKNSDQMIYAKNDSTHNYAQAAEMITQGTVKASDFDPITLSANQRVFYSDDMIDQGYARKLNARFGVDENTKEITSVHLYARRDSNDNSAINGLDLTVSKSGTVYHQNGQY